MNWSDCKYILKVGELSMKSIWTMGEMIVEIMRPRAEMPHEKADVYLGPYPSGAPAIMISSAARMGAPTGIIGGVGRDAFGNMMVQRLERYGVDCSHVLRSDRGSTGNAFVMYHEDGSREFIFHIDGTPAVEAPVPDVSKIEDPGYFHVMGCSLTANEDFCKRIVETAMAFRARGAKLSFDPNIRPELLHGGDLAAIIAPIVENCAILLPGVEELLMMSGETEVDAAVKKMFERETLEMIVLKNGSKGCRVFTREAQWAAPAYKVEQADATGAGDCFDGAFLAALSMGKPLDQAAREANAAGALNAAAFGPMEGNISPETVRAMIGEG